MKTCTKCEIAKPDEEFGKRKASKDGLKSHCKQCECEAAQIYRGNNKEKVRDQNKKYRQEHSQERAEKCREWRANNQEHVKSHAKQYRQKEHVKEAKRRYSEKMRRKAGILPVQKLPESEIKRRNVKRARNYKLRNWKKVTENQRRWASKRLKNDPGFRIRKCLATRIYHAVKGNSKSANTIKLLGCSIEEFLTYLERKFEKSMTFRNYGDWHVDHIIPCALFDLTKPEEQKACFHFENLQPMWAKDNLSKGAKIPKTENN